MISLDRRSALFGFAATGLASCASIERRRTRSRFGLADITVMRELSRDYAGTLREVAALGYTTMGFRLAGYGGREAGEPLPTDKARMVREAGLEIGVVRLGIRNPMPHDANLYAMRNRIERFFCKMKDMRRLATRFEKYAQNFLAMLHIFAIKCWIN